MSGTWRDLPDTHLAHVGAAGSEQDPAYSHDDRPTLAEYREQARRARRSDNEKAAEQARSDAIWAAAAALQNQEGAA